MTALRCSRRLDSTGATPFRTLERFADEVTRILDDFGLGRGWCRVSASGELMMWSPRVDVTQQNGETVIRVDLLGVEKDEITAPGDEARER